MMENCFSFRVSHEARAAVSGYSARGEMSRPRYAALPQDGRRENGQADRKTETCPTGNNEDSRSCQRN